MRGFHIDIEHATQGNTDFRRVLFTGPQSQLVLMTLKPQEEIGLEVHAENDQFLRIESGEGKAIIGDEEFMLQDGSAIVVPAGAQHNIINTSETEPLKLYTIYSPAHHPEGTVHHTKAEADEAEKQEHAQDNGLSVQLVDSDE